MCCLSLCCRVDMTAGSYLVFDHLFHNYIEPRAEYQCFGDVLLVHSDLSLDEILLFARGETVGGEDLFCGLYPPIEAMKVDFCLLWIGVLFLCMTVVRKADCFSAFLCQLVCNFIDRYACMSRDPLQNLRWLLSFSLCMSSGVSEVKSAMLKGSLRERLLLGVFVPRVSEPL